MSILTDYQGAFERISFRREDGILEIVLHTDGGSFVFDEKTHHEFGAAFHAVADDPDNRVVILTGYGERFCADFDYASFQAARSIDPERYWIRIRNDGMRMLTAFLDIQVPVISAINGPAVSHSELPLLADVVLAADTAVFQDATHFIAGIPPGDGMHVVWTTLLGLNRGRYFLMTGQKLSAQEALQAGVVGEVLPREELLPRAWAIARQWAAHRPLNLIGTRAILTAAWKRKMADDLQTGLTHEFLADVGRPIHAPATPVIDLLAAR
jgi:enoyl-CoA hydratase/carnithine racemase